jgi:hypothetical protein
MFISGSVSLSPSFLKDSFAGYRILGRLACFSGNTEYIPLMPAGLQVFEDKSNSPGEIMMKGISIHFKNRVWLSYSIK